MFSSPSHNKPLSSRRRKLSLPVVFLLVFVLGTTLISISPVNVHRALALTASGTGTDKIYTSTNAEASQYVDSLRRGTSNPAVMPPEAATLGYRWQSFGQAGTGFGGTYIIWKQVSNNLTPEQAAAQEAKNTQGGQNPTATKPPDQSIIWQCGTNLTCYTAWLADRVLQLFGYVLRLGGALLDISLGLPKYLGGFTTAAPVKIGWPIVRDLANMFFSLILLVIAFATILRIESYGMKQILWRLVVAALLINFSLAIAGVIIDGSNVLTNFFISPTTYQTTTGQNASISATIVSGLQLQKIYDMNNNTVGDINNPQGTTNITAAIQQSVQGQPGFSNIFVNLILGIIFILVAAFVFCAAAILFFIRMIVLWILLIFAPLAWLAMVLPGTRNLWNKWWHEFMKWIIFAPVYAFFLYLTANMINSGYLQNILGQSASISQDTGAGFFLSTFTSNISLILGYIVITAFLVAGLVFARSSGIVGATALSNWGTDLRKFGVRVASRWQAGGAKVPGAGRISEKLGFTQRLNNMIAKGGWQKGIATALRAPGATKSFLASKTNREVWVRALATMKQRADEMAFTVPSASVVGMWENLKGAFRGGSEVAVLSTKKGKPIQEGIDPITGAPIYKKEMKKISGLQSLKNLFSDDNLHVENAKQQLVARRMQEYGRIKDEDRLVQYYNQSKDPADREALLRILASINGLNTLFLSMGRAFNGKQLKNYIQEAFTPADAARIAADIQAAGAQNGNFSYVGLTKFDPRLGKNRFTSDSEQEDAILTKFNQLEYQQGMRTLHTDSVMGFDVKGQRVWDRFGDAILKRGLSAGHGEHYFRAQPRMQILLNQINVADPTKINKDFLAKKAEKEAARAPGSAPTTAPDED